MKILLISKYPPLQGGVSSLNYWLAKGLGERGHKIYVISNSWDINSYYKEELTSEDMGGSLEPKNVELFSTNSNFRPPIPAGKYYTARLANLAIDAIRKFNVDVIHTNYLLPYGVAGMIAKQATGVPLVVQHAGSDISRLFSIPELESLFKEIYRSADISIGGNFTSKRLKEHGLEGIRLRPINFFINTKIFHPSVNPFDFSQFGKKTVFIYFGKISKLKKTYEFIDAAAHLPKEKYVLVFVTESSPNTEALRAHIANLGMKDNCHFLPFQPPWKIPSLMIASDCVVSPEGDETAFFPRGTHNPKIVREAMACGKCAIIGKEVSEKYLYQSAKDMEHFIVTNPTNKKMFAERLAFVIKNPKKVNAIGENARKFAEKHENFSIYLDQMEGLYSSVLKS